MLSPNDLSLLYKIISDKNQTFENISKVFQLNFNKDSQIKVSTTLLILLKDNLLNIYQRINSYYILYIISKKEKKKQIRIFLLFWKVFKIVMIKKNKIF